VAGVQEAEQDDQHRDQRDQGKPRQNDDHTGWQTCCNRTLGGLDLGVVLGH